MPETYVVEDHMDFQLTAVQVNEFLAKAMLESRIGEVVKAAVDKQVRDLAQSYNNPFESVVKQEVGRLILETIRDTHSAYIREKVQAQLTDEVLGKIIDAAVAYMLKQINDRSY